MTFLTTLLSKFKKDTRPQMFIGDTKGGTPVFKGFSHTVEEGQHMAKNGHYAEIPDPDVEFTNNNEDTKNNTGVI